MCAVHLDILNTKRKAVFKKLKNFSDFALLSEGTALGLQIAHRKSYDFDLFLKNPLKKELLKKVIKIFGDQINLLVDTSDELSFLSPEEIKVSFIYFPFERLYPPVETDSLPLIYWQDIASDKAYVIGRRGEYRDYVDLFFILKSNFSLGQIIADAQKKFKGAFSEKLFLGQLVYFGDLRDFKVDFFKEKYSPNEIKRFLEKVVSKYTKKLI